MYVLSIVVISLVQTNAVGSVWAWLIWEYILTGFASVLSHFKSRLPPSLGSQSSNTFCLSTPEIYVYVVPSTATRKDIENHECIVCTDSSVVHSYGHFVISMNPFYSLLLIQPLMFFIY